MLDRSPREGFGNGFGLVSEDLERIRVSVTWLFSLFPQDFTKDIINAVLDRPLLYHDLDLFIQEAWCMFSCFRYCVMDIMVLKLIVFNVLENLPL